MTFIVATNVIASRLPKRRPTGTPHASANYLQEHIKTISNMKATSNIKTTANMKKPSNMRMTLNMKKI